MPYQTYALIISKIYSQFTRKSWAHQFPNQTFLFITKKEHKNDVFACCCRYFKYKNLLIHSPQTENVSPMPAIPFTMLSIFKFIFVLLLLMLLLQALLPHLSIFNSFRTRFRTPPPIRLHPCIFFTFHTSIIFMTYYLSNSYRKSLYTCRWKQLNLWHLILPTFLILTHDLWNVL